MFSSEKCGCCFKAQIRYFVLCFVNSKVPKNERVCLGFCFPFSISPPNEKEGRKNVLTIKLYSPLAYLTTGGSARQMKTTHKIFHMSTESVDFLLARENC